MSVYDIVAVVTQPDRAVGRKKEIRMTPVKEVAWRMTCQFINRKNCQGQKNGAIDGAWC